ncbi:MAG TPA: CinA family protein [Actinomycetales bacterium]|nr:CinA family protein [Actinomycetales bacterium]
MTADEVPGDRVEDVAAELVELLLTGGSTVATAESLTGGLVGAAITAVPGCSAVYRGGVVSYATELKAQLLDVDRSLLAELGAVHRRVAEAMADGARQRLDADYAVATTGVAGPSPQDGRRPGTVFVGVAGPHGIASFDESLDDDGPTPLDRETVRRTTTMRALRRLRDRVREDLLADAPRNGRRRSVGDEVGEEADGGRR